MLISRISAPESQSSEVWESFLLPRAEGNFPDGAFSTLQSCTQNVKVSLVGPLTSRCAHPVCPPICFAVLPLPAPLLWAKVNGLEVYGTGYRRLREKGRWQTSVLGEEQSWFETPSWMVLEKATRKNAQALERCDLFWFPVFEVKARNTGAFKNVEANRCLATKTLVMIY